MVDSFLLDHKTNVFANKTYVNIVSLELLPHTLNDLGDKKINSRDETKKEDLRSSSISQFPKKFDGKRF